MEIKTYNLMKENMCDFTKDDGTWCNNKGIQIAVVGSTAMCLCRKHKLSSNKKTTQEEDKE